MKFPLTAQHTTKQIFLPQHRKIGSCMTYRSDIVWIDITAAAETVLALIKKYSNFCYFPVCAGKIDTVIGILNVRDYLLSRLEQPSPPLQKIVTKPLFIPESQTIGHTLELLKDQKVNTACIIDEYGGIEGFVTKNGLLSVLLNESSSNGGQRKQELLKQADGGVIVSAQMSLDEVQALHLLEEIERTPHEDYYTLAGYLLTRMDAIPRPGDSITIGSSTCTVLSMTGQRIDQVVIRAEGLSE
ncbi:MAG: transporter associated domain-containing protein [Treponema sp.]|uniref:transporter associated domain-containing protein n=1 Tax=Treponema sp. TaxID=166 RepID=UPI003FA1EDD0